MNSSQDASPRNCLDADWPIESRSQDLLNRSRFAEKIARQVSNVPANQGFTIAITGEWGSGKTSVLNMVKEALEEDGESVVVLHFNPWLFGGASNLVRRFFREVTSQIRQYSFDGLKAVIKTLAEFGEEMAPLSPFPGTTAFARLFSKVTSLWAKPLILHKKRDQLKDALSKSKCRLVVLFDDIDRLEPWETREVMRLVRLTTDLPNVVFLLAFDIRRVAKSLGDNDEEDGMQYLNKIIQDSYHLPMVGEGSISAMLIDRLNKMLDGRDIGRIDNAAMTSVLSEVVKPLLGNLRDVKRYLNALPLTLDMVEYEVALPDILGLEAVRVLRPSIFYALKAHPEYLVHSEAVSLLSMSDENRANLIKEGLMAILDQAGDKRRVVESVFLTLFPATAGYLGGISRDRHWNSTWRRERRVGCEEVFNIYLRGGLEEGVITTREVDNLVEALADEHRLTQLLDALNDTRLERALERLLDFHPAFPEDAVPIAVPVIVNLMDRLSNHSVGMSDYSPRMKASRIVYRLLDKKRVPEDLMNIMSEILPKVNSLSGQLELIEMVGGHEGVGRKLLAKGQEKELKEELISRMESATAQELAGEWGLSALLHRTMNWVEGEDWSRIAKKLRKHLSDDKFVITLWCTDESYHSSNGKFQKLLAWDALFELFGKGIEDAAYRLATSTHFDELSQNDQDAIILAKQYAAGWRPEKW